jgi:hypothetical protein
MGKRLTTEEFITKAKSVHGDRYDYSKSVYINAQTKVTIVCPTHGDFDQTPSNHVYGGYGCKKCSGERLGVKFSRTLEDFINDARSVHGDKYDYSESIYVNRKTKLTIKCPKHGGFPQRPGDHLRGDGCPTCSGRSNKLWKEKYFSVASELGFIPQEPYKDKDTKILHKCVKHGEIHPAAPHNIKNGRGLKCCGTESSKQEGRRKAAEAFSTYKQRLIESGNRVELVDNYIDSRTPVKHRCKIHDEVHLCSPSVALQGCGLKCCKTGKVSYTSLCRDSTYAEEPMEFYVASVDGKYIKPGIATNSEIRADKKYEHFYLVSDKLTKGEAWVIEQIILNESRLAKPETLEAKFFKWYGATELRLKEALPVEWYEDRFWDLLDEVKEFGWEQVYNTHMLGEVKCA